jgi:hypothetical protein
MQIKKIASFDVKDGASTVRYADLDDGISFFPTDGIINIKSNKVRIAGFGVDANSLYRIKSSGEMYPLGDQNSVFLSNAGKETGASIGGSTGNNKWLLAISDDFGVTDGGTLYATNANIHGEINAERGRIADYTIDGAMLVGNNVGLSGTSGQGWAFWAGSNDAGDAPFRVGHDGSLNASRGTIGGITINSNSITAPDFSLSSDGVLTANNANISGTISGSNITSDCTITGSIIEGGRIGAQYIQTNSNRLIDGVDILTGAIRLNELRSQNNDSGYIRMYAHEVWLSDGTRLSSGQNEGVRKRGYPVVSMNDHSLGMYWGTDNNLHVVVDVTDFKIQLKK